MQQSVEGWTALVTGASRGIGRAIAVELARAGVKVALNHHPQTLPAEIDESARAVAAVNGQYIHVYGDVSKPEDPPAMVDRVLKTWGQLDILVNNAGIIRDRTLRKMTLSEWQDVLNVDLNGAFLCCSAVVPGMIERKSGRIINISSIVAQSGNFGQTNYAAAKAGLIGFTKSAALELARYGITVNAICPGFTETGMTESIPPDVMERLKARIPLGRLAHPEEIADAVVFLARSTFITGQQLNVNGGLYM